MAYSPPPLTGIRVLELAGLAPGPFAGLMLADYGATVIRIDRPHPAAAHTTNNSTTNPTTTTKNLPPPPAPDLLTRHKISLAIDLSTPRGRALLLSLLPSTDILLDPFRPGVLERLSLPPALLHRHNPRLIIARLTGYRRDGAYAAQAGHDINYLAVAGVLGLLGRKTSKPYAPGNILGDFAGGGMVCVVGVLMALLARERSGRGQVVEANMVDGSGYLATWPRLQQQTGVWGRARGENLLDGGCPWYDTYETKDGKYVAVGALEERFFAQLCRGLDVDVGKLPGRREDRAVWPHLRMLFTAKFRSRTRAEWEEVFRGTDACVAPVLGMEELREGGYQQRPAVTLRESPGWAVAEGEADGRTAEEGQGVGVEGSGWEAKGLGVGEGGEEMLAQMMGWKRGVHYEVEGGGLVLIDRTRKSKSKL